MKANFYFVISLQLLSIVSFAQEKMSDEEILKIYDGLHVADVSDGLDMLGLRDAGLTDQRMERYRGYQTHYCRRYIVTKRII